ncbi:hypothetical protein Trydic_g17990 [Trypoxylus dichotomus]
MSKVQEFVIPCTSYDGYHIWSNEKDAQKQKQKLYQALVNTSWYFGTKRVELAEHEGKVKKIDDEKSQALLDENNIQTQQELAEAFNFDQSVISRYLHGMGMVKKLGNWIAHELRQKRKDFLH